MMLWFLDNGSSTAGNPNENYAREIQELYSMGTSRWDDACTTQVRNYYEEYDGLRQLGDIFQATLALTGWLVTDRLIDGERYYRSAYSEADHRPGVQTMYRGTPWQRQVSSIDDVVEAILNHPGTAQGLAADLLKAYVTPQPNCQQITVFAKVIRAQNYNLRQALSTLLRSNLFYHSRFRDTVVKSPLVRTAQFVNALGLTYGQDDLVNRATAIITDDIGVDVGWIVDGLEAMGMPINSPSTVFYYDEAAYYSSLGFARQVNLYWDIATDRSSIVRLLGTTSGPTNDPTYEYYSWWRPGGEALARDVILHVARLLRVNLTEDQIKQLETFMNYSRNWQDPTQLDRYVYDNKGSEDKLVRLYAIIASMPGYFTS
jgi:uncharacterized protein (DUF1800 family)